MPIPSAPFINLCDRDTDTVQLGADLWGAKCSSPYSVKTGLILSQNSLKTLFCYKIINTNSFCYKINMTRYFCYKISLTSFIL